MADLRVNPQETGMSSVDYEDMAIYGDSTKYTDQFEVENLDTDGSNGLETTYIPDWSKWHGYYRKIPEFQAAVDKFGSWTVGRGFEADKKNESKVKKIYGFGKDDFESILENMIRAMLICGDSFAEIIRDKQKRVLNIKPLNPGNIKIIANDSGIVDRYEQFTDSSGRRYVVARFAKDDIIHLSWNRIADEIHGIPFGEKSEDIIKMRNECMQDMRVLFHRYVKPIQIIQVDSDKDSDLTLVQNSFDTAYKKTENIIIPKGIVEQVDRVSIPQFSTLDPLPWLQYLVRQFVTSCGVPEVIMGWGSETTEASSKIIYLAFQQTIEEVQLYMENQMEIQTGIKIKLNFPASIEEDLKSDEKKDAGYQTKPSVSKND